VLLQLREYLAREQIVSLEQLARFFQTDATALEPMLDVWVSKGVIQREIKKATCASVCKGCDTGTATYYHYVK
jgi:hypothetical protein